MRSARLTAAVLIALFALLLVAPAVAAFQAREDGQAQTAPQSQTQGDGSWSGKAIAYLKARQQSDGGFAEPGKSSSELLTMWTVCGLASVGQDVNSWRKSGNSPLDFLSSRASKLTKLTDIEMACLAASSAGRDPRSFGGRNLVAEIKAKMASDGHIGDLVNEHCWGVIALKAAGEALPDGSRSWLVSRQNIDGGYGYGADTGSDPDDTGAALQALIAAGESPQGNAVKRAISYLHFCQSPDAGFTYNADQSNVASTAWAVQGIVAAGQDPGSQDWTRSGKTPLDYLGGTQQSDGHFRYMKSSDANAAWMTAEALPAMSKKAFPLAPEQAPTRSDNNTRTTTNTSTTTTTTSDSDGQADEGAAESDAAGAEGGAQPQEGTASGAPSRKKASSGTSSEGALARDVSFQGEVARQGGQNGLAVFGVICALYLVVLGLAYVSLSYYYAARRTRPYPR